MKRFISCITAFLLSITLCTMPAFAATGNDEAKIPVAFLKESECTTKLLPSGETVIVLSQTRKLPSRSIENNFESTTYSIFPDSDDEIDDIVGEITAIKQNIGARGSGTFTDDEWYHGQSLCISSTVNYSTTLYRGLTYGKITSVYVNCSVTNGTVLDSISLHIQQSGYVMGSGRETYDQTTSVANRSTTSTPSDWGYILWDSSSGSFAGGKVTATVHRGTSGQYTYSFPNNVVQ